LVFKLRVSHPDLGERERALLANDFAAEDERFNEAAVKAGMAELAKRLGPQDVSEVEEKSAAALAKDPGPVVGKRIEENSEGDPAVEGVDPQADIKEAVKRVAKVDVPEYATIQEDVQWVYRNVETPWKDLDERGIPSRGAMGLLRAAKRNPEWFYMTYHSKFMPSRTQVERDEFLKTDCDRIEELVDGVLTAAERLILST